MPTATRQIFAYSGILYPEPGGPDSFALIEYALSVGLHYVGTELREAVSVLDGKRAWLVRPGGDGGYIEEPAIPRLV